MRPVFMLQLLQPWADFAKPFVATVLRSFFSLCKTDALWTPPMTRPCPEVDATKAVSHRRAKLLKA